MLALFAALLCHVHGQTVPQLNKSTYWLANSSGKPTDHIQNFIEHMSVVYVNSHQFPRPLILTKSFWDEGHVPNAAYHNGKRIDANWWPDSVNSRLAKRGKDTCSIINFYGRAFLYKIAPAPTTGDSVPHVACNDGSTIRSVADPTAIAFDNSGNLLVADNSPDQDIKIFSRSAGKWTLMRTFGNKSGVFGGPVPGATGPRRFWGIRGLGVDSAGNIYVGNTGIPMQIMGGTDIRAFSGKDSSLLWQVQGLAFVNSADAEPGSDGTSIHLNAKRFKMDWTQPPEKAWKHVGVSLDPFRFPDDIRLQSPLETAWIRVIGGKKFLFATTMRSDFVAVFRILPNEEIAAPCAVFAAGSQKPRDWMDSIRPTVDATTPATSRMAWIDNNGDGRVQKEEFTTFNVVYSYIKAIDVADDGTIRFGGRVALTAIRCLGVAANGVPNWDMKNVVKERIPFTEGSGDVQRMRYLQAQDMMFLSGTTSKYPNFIYAYRNWSDSTKRTSTRIAIPYADSGAAVTPKLDINTYDMALPAGFTADPEYAYAMYIDRGPSAICVDVVGMHGPKGDTMKCRGEIAVMEAATGKYIGYFAPDSAVGYYAGATDMYHPITVSVRNNGERLILAEEDGTGKILAYRWCPPGKACGQSVKTDPDPKTRIRWKTNSHGLLVEGLAPGALATARVRTVDGRMLGANTSSSGAIQIPKQLLAGGVFVLEVETSDRSTQAIVSLP